MTGAAGILEPSPSGPSLPETLRNPLSPTIKERTQLALENIALREQLAVYKPRPERSVSGRDRVAAWDAHAAEADLRQNVKLTSRTHSQKSS